MVGIHLQCVFTLEPAVCILKYRFARIFRRPFLTFKEILHSHSTAVYKALPSTQPAASEQPHLGDAGLTP